MNEFQLECIQKSIERDGKIESEYKIKAQNEWRVVFDQLKVEFPSIEMYGSNKFILFGDVYNYRVGGWLFSEDASARPGYELYDSNSPWLRFSTQESYGRYLQDRYKEIPIPKSPPINYTYEGSENFVRKFFRDLFS